MTQHTVTSALALSDTLTSDTARLDTELLLAHAISKTRTWLYTWPDKALDTAQFNAFKALMARRQKGEPVAYLLGEQEFWSLALKVSPKTLIPRCDTERLVEVVLEYVQKHTLTAPSILDLGCGTGAIALALASELPKAKVLGLDKIPDAVSLSKHNAQQLNITNAHFAQSDWFSFLNSSHIQHFDIIVSNPPYIDKNDAHLTQGDVFFEPSSALIADNNGLSDIEHIIEQSPKYLKTPSALFFEHGWQQGQAVMQLLKQKGFKECETCQDLAGLDRVTYGLY